MDGQPQLLRRDGVGHAGRELRPVPLEGPARSASTAGSTGASGTPRTGRKRQAVEVVADNVQFLGSRDGDGGGGGGQQFVPPGSLPARDRRLPRSRGRRRHPVLGERQMAQPKTQQTRKRPGSSVAPGRAEELPLLQGQGRRGRLQEPATSSGATSRRRGRSATAASPARAGATSGRSRSRSSGRARWRSCPTSRAKLAMDVILLRDVEKVGLRGEVVERRARLRPQLPAAAQARRAGDAGAASPSSKRLDDQRARHEARTVDQANEIADALRQDGADVRRQVGADRRALRLGDDRPTSPTSSGGRARSASTGGRSSTRPDQADRPLHDPGRRCSRTSSSR